MLLLLTRELLSRRVVVRLLLRLNDRTCPSLVRRATSFSNKVKIVQGRRSIVIKDKPTEAETVIWFQVIIEEVLNCQEHFVSEEEYAS